MSKNTEEDDDAFCERILVHGDHVDERSAYTRFLARNRRRMGGVPWKPLGALAVLVLGVLVFTTPLGSFAQGFLTIFQPKTFAPIDISSVSGKHVHVLPDLNEFGSTHERGASKERIVANLAAASALAGFHAMAPSTLPSPMPRSVRYIVKPHSEESFTFSAALRQRVSIKPCPRCRRVSMERRLLHRSGHSSYRHGERNRSGAHPKCWSLLKGRRPHCVAAARHCKNLNPTCYRCPVFHPNWPHKFERSAI
jgi:hypothetical protein